MCTHCAGCHCDHAGVPAYLLPLPEPSQLGALPTIGGALDLGKSLFSGIFGGASKCETEGRQRVDAAFAGAMRGDLTAETCLHDMAQGIYQHGEEGTRFNPPRSCALGCKGAVTYAQVKWAEFQARKIAGSVGNTLVGAGPQSGGFVQTVTGVATSPWLWLVVGAGAFVLLRRRGR